MMSKGKVKILVILEWTERITKKKKKETRVSKETRQYKLNGRMQ